MELFETADGVTADPIERVREWTSAIFVIALAAVTLPVCVWEMVVRHGQDPGVDSALAFSIGVIVAGKVAIVRAKGRVSHDE